MAKKYHNKSDWGYGAKLPDGAREFDMENSNMGLNWEAYPDNVPAIDAFQREEDKALRKGLKPKKLG